eukprot:15360533-Ditylum_brightwellii.AAC.1
MALGLAVDASGVDGSLACREALCGVGMAFDGLVAEVNKLIASVAIADSLVGLSCGMVQQIGSFVWVVDMYVCRVVIVGLEYLAMGRGVVPMPMSRLVSSVYGVGAISVALGGRTALFTLSMQHQGQHGGGDRQRCVIRAGFFSPNADQMHRGGLHALSKNLHDFFFCVLVN